MRLCSCTVWFPVNCQWIAQNSRTWFKFPWYEIAFNFNETQLIGPAKTQLPLPPLDPQSNVTPIRHPFRHTMWQGRCNPSPGTTNANVSGMPTWLDTSSAAPVLDRLRTVQSMAPPPKSIVPAFNTRCRAACRVSTIISIPNRKPRFDF